MYKIESKSHRSDIQILRGVAVLAVVLFHAFPKVVPNGYLGVDVFFVISGFVVTPLVLEIFQETDSRNSIRNRLGYFYTKRTFRLLPALGATLLGSALIIVLFGPVGDHQRFASQGLATLAIVGNLGAYKFSNGNYFAPNPNPLVHFWSLSAEEQIYIFLPLYFILCFFIFRIKKSMSVWLVSFAGILAFGTSVALSRNSNVLNQVGIDDAKGFIFYTPVFRFWEFAIGSTICLFLAKNPKFRFKWGSKLLPQFILIILLFTPIFQIGWGSSLSCLLAGILIVPQLAQRQQTKPAVLLEWIGDRSYSIYLVHMPLLYLAMYSQILQFFGIRYLVVIALAVTVLLGHAMYSKVENRYRINSQTTSENLKFNSPNLPVLILKFALVPAIIYVAVFVASNANYWGLNPNPAIPQYATSLDANCSRDGSSFPCEYPVVNQKGEILLIGDSHAGSFSQAIVDVAKKNNFSAYIWAKSGCQFFIENLTVHDGSGLYQHDAHLKIEGPSATGQSWRACFTHNQEIINWLSKHPETIVVVAQRNNRPDEIIQAKYVDLLVKNLQFLRDHSKNLILVGPTPEFPDGSSYFSGQLSLIQSKYDAPKGFPLYEMNPKTFSDSGLLKEKLKNLDIQYIDGSTFFCESNFCSRWNGEEWLYRDNHHLSVAGARRLILPLQEIIEVYRNSSDH